jgi:carboxyl-terminal processing protease
MKNRERIVWISVVSVLLVVLFFGVFINEVQAGSLRSDLPYIQKFISVMKIIKSEYVDTEAIDEKKMIEGAISGMMEALEDPYSVYLSEEDLSDLNMTSDGKFGGVGMIISEKDDYIVVVSPIEGTPAFRKGLKAGDMIVEIDEETTQGLKVSEAANRLRGVPGTIVKIKVMRDEVFFDVEIKRAIIDVPTVKQTIIDDKYGYLRITQFAGTTDKYVKKYLKEMITEKNVEALIVDLRSNPGGLLTQVIDIVDYFQDDGVIVSTRGRRQMDSQVSSASQFTTIVPAEIPLIVLIDKGSASASEIFAGAIKDHKRGIILGETSYGKASVQTIRRLGKDGLKFTIAKYYTPSGTSIHEIGIEPNLIVAEPELSDDETEALKKLYDDKAVEELIKTNSDPTSAEIDVMVKSLIKDGYNLPERYLRKLVKNEAEYDDEEKTLVDLDFDLQLKKAIELLENDQIIFENSEFLLKE